MLNKDYNELINLLDSNLEKEKLNIFLPKKSKEINYKKRNRFIVIFKTLLMFYKARSNWNKFIKYKLKRLEKNQNIYNILENEGCIRDLKVNVYLFRFLWGELCKYVKGKYDDGIASNFALAILFYDISFDIPSFNRYMTNFNNFIEGKKVSEERDLILDIFVESTELIKSSLNKKYYDNLIKYVKIAHIIHILSSKKFSNVKKNKEDIIKTSYSKGGISCLAIMNLFQVDLNETQKKALFLFGGALQTMDDFFDAEKDIKEGIQTIANKKLQTKDEIKENFYGSVNNLIEAFNIQTEKVNMMLEMMYRLSDEIIDKKM